MEGLLSSIRLQGKLSFYILKWDIVEQPLITELVDFNSLREKNSKISLVIVFSVLSAIYFFPLQISQNPLFPQIGSSNILLRGTWLTLLAAIGGYIVLSICVEARSRNRILVFELETKQESIFCDFLNQEVARYNSEFLGAVFNTHHLANYILETEHSKGNKFLQAIIDKLFNVNVVNELIAIKLSEIIVKKAEYKKLIRKTDDFPALSESYEILIEFIA